MNQEQREANKIKLKNWRMKQKELGLKVIRPPEYYEKCRQKYAQNRDSILKNRKRERVEHADQRKVSSKKWRDTNKESLRQRRKTWRAGNGERIRVKQREWRERNRVAVLARAKTRRDNLRLEVLSRYGGVCAHCSESRLEFLAIDHIRDDGASHREVIGNTIYSWLRKNGFPQGFQVLCHNHNLKKAKLVMGVGKSGSARMYARYKDQCLSHYTRECSCCGEKDPDTLCLDHIEGGGRKHLATQNIKSNWAWAKRNSFPPTLRVLCANCNWSAFLGSGVCCHRR